MQIAEIMKLIPDDGAIEFKNNSGLVHVKLSLYDHEIETRYKREDIDEKIEPVLNNMIKELKDFIIRFEQCDKQCK